MVALAAEFGGFGDFGFEFRWVWGGDGDAGPGRVVGMFYFGGFLSRHSSWIGHGCCFGWTMLGRYG